MELLSWLLGALALFALFRLIGRSGRSAGKGGRRSSERPRGKQGWRRARLFDRLRYRSSQPRFSSPAAERTPPYRFARREVRTGRYLDLSGDIDRAGLARWGLPVFGSPDELAHWLELTAGKVAWLTARFLPGERFTVGTSHYVYSWERKRSGGARLIESPKPLLRQVQTRILREILDRVPPHPAAHGFARGRSIVTNARPHCGHEVVAKWDLADFYASVRLNRVVAIFRSLGYSREAAIWLASLTTSAAPPDLPIAGVSMRDVKPYASRHLPQGAPTSPALANLSAFSLDVRLSGLAKAFGGVYTRYADDITISGDIAFARRLRNVIPLVEQVIRQERFHVHPTKRKVLRQSQRQTVAGVVVNEKPNIRRDAYDLLKATLHNSAKFGAASQNRENHPDFAAHLRGRIAHIAMLNPARGEKLMRLYQQINFE